VLIARDPAKKVALKRKRMGVLEWIVALVTTTCFGGLVHILSTTILAAYLTGSMVLYTALAVVVGTVFLPRAPLLWPAFKHGWMFRCWRQYFSFRAIIHGQLDPNTHYLHACFPHGVAPYGIMLGGSVLPRIFPNCAPCYGISSSMMFRIPIYRHVMTWLGCEPATSSNFKALLKRGSCAVVVGGLAEMYMQDESRERILLKSRKGFIRVALETGSPLVPSYYFGNTKLMSVVASPFIQRWSRRLRFAFMLAYGRWFLPVPYRVPVMLAMGKPIPVERRETPTEAEIDELHAKFVVELKRLFDENKGHYGWDHVELSVE